MEGNTLIPVDFVDIKLFLDYFIISLNLNYLRRDIKKAV